MPQQIFNHRSNITCTWFKHFRYKTFRYAEIHWPFWIKLWLVDATLRKLNQPKLVLKYTYTCGNVYLTQIEISRLLQGRNFQRKKKLKYLVVASAKSFLKSCPMNLFKKGKIKEETAGRVQCFTVWYSRIRQNICTWNTKRIKNDSIMSYFAECQSYT